jgi:hypothetical protein
MFFSSESALNGAFIRIFSSIKGTVSQDFSLKKLSPLHIC